jgi:hypothetical protein
MTQQHPIIPPPELFAEWLADAKRLHPGESTGFIAGEIARLAYQAGADQELEACCEWLDDYLLAPKSSYLRAARRPKPPSLKKQALEALTSAPGPDYPVVMTMLNADQHALIRRALEQLDD